jgi:hypothetical protein
MNGKHADATLRASGTTRQPLAAASGCIRERNIHDLEQRSIAGRQSPQRHIARIPQGAGHLVTARQAQVSLHKNFAFGFVREDLFADPTGRWAVAKRVRQVSQPRPKNPTQAMCASVQCLPDGRFCHTS